MAVGTSAVNVIDTRCVGKEFHIDVAEGSDVNPARLSKCLLEALSSAPACDSEVILVDLSATSREVICSETFDDVLASLALRKDVRRVQAPRSADIILGRCEGIVNRRLKELLGDSIVVNGVQLKTRDVLNVNRTMQGKFLDNDDPSDDISVALEVLARMEREYPIPGPMTRAITRAHNAVLKNKRVLKAHRRQERKRSKKLKEQTSNTPTADEPPIEQTGGKQNKCYICGQHFNRGAPTVKLYPKLCNPCGEFNLTKRTQKVRLHGKYAVVTGGRIKIGFEIVLKLLRDGCSVIASTRFPQDAAKRFAEVDGFDVWKDRLKIYEVDLMDLQGISRFIQFVKETFPCLDILINNAAQTIRRPKQFFQHLIPTTSSKVLPPCQLNLIANDEHPVAIKKPRMTPDLVLPYDSSALSKFFPIDCFDEHGQQLDLRPTNSWRSQLEDVPPSELLEVLLVNVVAPFLLTQQLRPLLLQRRGERRFVVNVSAMEGQFQRIGKTKFHPHTNMAKAALNMMTRTAALGFAEDGIYMTAVDTGWVTDERPFHMAQHEKQTKGFELPLDCVDGAARVYDPIVMGMKEKATPCHGVFLKDYKPFPW